MGKLGKNNVKTHQINVTPGEYAVIVEYDVNDWVQMLRPLREGIEIGDIVHLREYVEGWGFGRNCYRKVVNIVMEPPCVDINGAGVLVGLILNVWFGERVSLECAEFKAIPRAIEIEHLAAA